MQAVSLRRVLSGGVPMFVMAHFAHHMLTALPVPLLPFIRADLGLNYTQAALVISAFTVPYGIAQLPGGWFADRIGARALIAVGIAGVGLAGLLAGLAQHYYMLLAMLSLMGLAGGGYHPAAPPAISAVVDVKNRGRALGLHTIGGGASYFLAPLVAAGIASAWGWRTPFLVLAVPVMVFGVFFYAVLGRRLGTGTAEAEPSAAAGARGGLKASRSHLAAFLVLSTFSHAVILAVVSFVPLYFIDDLGVSKELGAASVAFVYSSGLWAGPVGGHLSDRVGRVALVTIVCMMGAVAVVLLTLVTQMSAAVALLVLLGIVIYVRMPVSEAYIVGQTTGRYRSTILGIYFFACLEGGGVLIPAVGHLVELAGFETAFRVSGAATALVTAVCWVWFRRARS